MEVIKTNEIGYGKKIDEIAERVFQEAISLLGGLRNLIEYKNLTWLPSLAASSYVIVMKNIGGMSNFSIAKALGLSEETVKNILSADVEKFKKWLEKEEKVNEHKAGALAKLAFEKLKKENRLEGGEISIEEAKELGIEWAIYVLKAIKGMHFPIEKEQLKEKLKAITIKGKRGEEIAEELSYPIHTPAELLKKIKEVI